MRSYNPSLFGDYFPFEKNIKFLILYSLPIFWPVLTQSEGYLAHTKTETPWGKNVAETSICPEPEVVFLLHLEHGKFMGAFLPSEQGALSTADS